MKTSLSIRFPTPVDALLRKLSEVGFFDRSLLIGSWVMPFYKELYGVHYLLRTLDVDFAIHLAHPQKQMRADLELLIMELGFVTFMSAGGVQKFTAAGYEVEFITHRAGGRDVGAVDVREWNINAVPLPFINTLTGFSETVVIDDYTVRIPIPEAYFIHKLIVAPRRRTGHKRDKDLEQCTILIPALSDQRLHQVIQAQRFSKATRLSIAQSCESIAFPLQRIFP